MTDPTFTVAPEASADQLFQVAEVPEPGANESTPQSQPKGPLSFTDPNLGIERFRVRANGTDQELTPTEVERLVQKGFLADKQAAEIGELRKATAEAEHWRKFEQAMMTNPGTALAAYAAQHGYVVGTANGEEFTPFDPHSPGGPNAQAATTTDPQVQALLEKVEAQQQLMQALLAERQVESLAQQHGATPQETQAAQAILQERNLPASAMDLALQLVRAQQPPAPPAQPAQPATHQIPDLDPMNGSGVDLMNAFLLSLKEGNPTMPGSSMTGGSSGAQILPKPLEEMTSRERTEAYWKKYKADNGIRGGV